ncbi:MAG: hypothetical protein ABSG74_09830, partial [Candidatus Bathyarchaeia archaeon]
MKRLMLAILVFCMFAAMAIRPAFASTPVLTYLVGSSLTTTSTQTWTTQGTGVNNGNYQKTEVGTYAYSLIGATPTSFTESESFSVNETETASGWFVSGSDYVKCDGCTATGSWSASGTITYALPSLLATAVSGNFASDNIGRATSDLVDPAGLSLGKQIGLWWYDQNGNYETVQYSVSGEKDIMIGNANAKTRVLEYTGLSQGLWRTSSGKSSSGQLTHMFYVDESTGFILGRHNQGSFSLQQSGGGWQETFTDDESATSASFKIGDYVILDTDPATDLSVDGSTVAAYLQPQLFVWSWDSTHSVTATPTVSVSKGTRLIFQEWSDGSKNPTRTLTADSPGELTANYKRQFLLTIVSPYGGTGGSGWYDEGSTATVHVDSSAYFVFVFASWSGYSLPSSPDAQVTMNGPVTLQANWNLDIVRLAVVIVLIVGIIGMIMFYRRWRTGPVSGPYERVATEQTPVAPAPLPYPREEKHERHEPAEATRPYDAQARYVQHLANL